MIFYVGMVLDSMMSLLNLPKKEKQISLPKMEHPEHQNGIGQKRQADDEDHPDDGHSVQYNSGAIPATATTAPTPGTSSSTGAHIKH